jgi:uncharacterized protein
MRLVTALLLAVIGVAPNHIHAASFDCGVARTPVERAICSNPSLGALDSQLADLYRAVREAERDSQRAWLRQRNECGGDVNCLTRKYYERLEQLIAVQTNSMVWQLGQCVITEIKRITTRLYSEGKPVNGSGSHVIFSNEFSQISYETVPEIEASRPGDRVLLCYIDRDHDCPLGTIQILTFTATNLRLHQSWTLANSTRSCRGPGSD